MADNSKLAEVIGRCHQILNELFLLHQEAVLQGRFDQALQLLKLYKELHNLHMLFEDEKLIPALDGLSQPGYWSASLYTAEHSKVVELLAKVEAGVLSLSRSEQPERELRREVIAFLEQEKTFKGVCEHHQEREEAGLLAELDAQADAAWRADIIEVFLQEWGICLERTMTVVDGMEF